MIEDLAVIGGHSLPGPAAVLSAGRRPSARTNQAVMTTAHQLLQEAGYDGVNFDVLARRAHVAKTTIYRWWPTKAALVLDLLEQDVQRRDLPVSAPDRLEVLFGPQGPPAFASVLAALALDLNHDRTQRRRLRRLLLAVDPRHRSASSGDEADSAQEPEEWFVETFCGRQIFRALFGVPAAESLRSGPDIAAVQTG